MAVRAITQSPRPHQAGFPGSAHPADGPHPHIALKAPAATDLGFVPPWLPQTVCAALKKELDRACLCSDHHEKLSVFVPHSLLIR